MEWGCDYKMGHLRDNGELQLDIGTGSRCMGDSGLVSCLYGADGILLCEKSCILLASAGKWMDHERLEMKGGEHNIMKVSSCRFECLLQ